jgi:hypothetical protein
MWVKKKLHLILKKVLLFGNVARSDYIVVRLSGKKHFLLHNWSNEWFKMDMNVKSVIRNSWKSPVNMSRKKKCFSILRSDILWKPAGMSKTSQFIFPVNFSALSASLATENVSDCMQLNIFWIGCRLCFTFLVLLP